jgi:uncharacterized membrane protein
MTELFGIVVIAFETLAVVVLILGSALFIGRFLKRVLRTAEREEAYHEFRMGFGRTLLLTLDLLVAADIVMTVTLDLNFETLGMLGLLVLIRTLVHFIVELEVTGRWPWQKHTQAEAGSKADSGAGAGQLPAPQE